MSNDSLFMVRTKTSGSGILLTEVMQEINIFIYVINITKEQYEAYHNKGNPPFDFFIYN